MKEKIKLTPFLILIIIFLVVLLFNQDVYRTFSTEKISAQNIKMLEELGTKAIDHLDIPVSSILLYKKNVIGFGYNTVLKYNNAGGHAEINAISNALKNIGHLSFSKLNKDSLTLITTYEPCPMCKGAITSYNIKNVIFIKEKSIKEHLKYFYSNLKYEFRKRKSVQDTLQEFLFKKHPKYPYKSNIDN